ncbi:MAG: class III poly(R)-hydroxyalkanoic acid synthase subunit PhaE [Chromatiales bacterium]|nr:class III poly(R)-hydroxyalkanoic acid synthase subunit PhaE [Chromatiales bacterium]
MSEQSFPFWNDQWMQIQKQYWDSLAEMSRKAAGQDATDPAHNPMMAAMDHWWNTVSGAAPDYARDFLGKMIEQGKQFFQLGHELTDGLKHLSDASGSMIDWHEQLNQAFARLKETYNGGTTDANNALHNMMGFWELPLDNWQRTVSSLSPVPGDLWQNMPKMEFDDVSKRLHEGVSRALSAPGLGYTRESQEQYQHLAMRWMDYQRAMQDYNGIFAKIGKDAIDRFRDKLLALGEAEKKLSSTRDLYNLWVDASEEVYGEYVNTEDYAEIHGRLVNSLMLYKCQMGALMDEMLGAMNMPTRREIDTLQCRQGSARRELKALRREVAALKKAVGATASAEPKPAVPRKKAAKKATAKSAPKSDV